MLELIIWFLFLAISLVLSFSVSICFGISLNKLIPNDWVVAFSLCATFYWSLMVLLPFPPEINRRIKLMANKVRFLQYKASKGCKNLVEALREEGIDALRLKVRHSLYKGFPTHLIINWGSSDRRDIREGIRIFNDPSAVRISGNKLKTFQNLPRDLCPDFTTDKEVATEWISQGYRVYCRTLLQSREGKGIVVAREEEELVDAPLYTKGLDVERELRVHVFDGEVIDFVQKKRMSSERLEEEGIEVDTDVRNHQKGWVFARGNVHINDSIKEKAIQAVQEIGLDFGAVDLVVTEQDTIKILEINTAPGLEGSTINSYKEAVIKKLRDED